MPVKSRSSCRSLERDLPGNPGEPERWRLANPDCVTYRRRALDFLAEPGEAGTPVLVAMIPAEAAGEIWGNSGGSGGVGEVAEPLRPYSRTFVGCLATFINGLSIRLNSRSTCPMKCPSAFGCMLSVRIVGLSRCQ